MLPLFQQRFIDRFWNGESRIAHGAGGNGIFVVDDDQIAVFGEEEGLIGRKCGQRTVRLLVLDIVVDLRVGIHLRLHFRTDGGFQRSKAVGGKQISKADVTAGLAVDVIIFEVGRAAGRSFGDTQLQGKPAVGGGDGLVIDVDRAVALAAQLQLMVEAADSGIGQCIDIGVDAINLGKYTKLLLSK